MKRRNLFLSLISSVLVAVAIVTVTIVTVIQPKKKNNQGGPVVTPIVDVEEVVDNSQYENENEFERDGSEEYPFLIYSAESFINLVSEYGGKEDRVITKAVTEKKVVDGKEVEVLKRDSEGYVIFEKVLDENGKETYGVYNFELVKDIQFTGVEFETLFNDGTSFKGNIDGKGFALSNISINVTTENLESKFSFDKSLEDANGNVIGANRFARIGIFGEMSGSKIKNLIIDKLIVNVDKEVYGFISNAKYKESKVPFAELSVGGLAAVATNVTLEKVNIEASVAGSSYINNLISINNAVGGVVAVAENVKMTESKVDVAISANAGTDYLVGGVAGYGREVEITKTDIATDIGSSFSNGLIMAGVFGYARTFTGSELNVDFVANETAGEAARKEYVAKLTSDSNGDACLAKAGEMSTLAGLVGILRADNSTQETTLTNIKVNSDVDFDGMFAGAIFDVYSANKTTFGLVELKNIIVNANVNVLAVHAFARQLVATTVSYDNTSEKGYCNIKVTGNVEFEKYTGTVIVKNVLGESSVQTVTYHGASILAATDLKYVSGTFKDLFIEASSDVDAVLQKGIAGISIKIGAFGSYKVVD